VYKANIRLTRYLHGTCLIAKLQNNGTDLGSTRGTNGMTFRKEPPIHIHGNSSFLIGCLFANELLSLSHRSKSKTLIGHDLCDGEAVVDFGHFNIFCVNSCHLIGLGGCCIPYAQALGKIGPCCHVHRL